MCYLIEIKDNNDCISTSYVINCEQKKFLNKKEINKFIEEEKNFAIKNNSIFEYKENICKELLENNFHKNNYKCLLKGNTC